MHPLATFPQLLTFGLVAPLLLRLTVGFLRLGAGWVRWNKEYKWTAILYFISSVLIIIGLYTQVAVIVALVLVVFDYFLERKAGNLNREKMALTVLMKVILISLLFTGPGFLAFDLPL